MKKVLLVIDMLNDFIKEDGALFFPQGQAIIPNVVAKIKEYSETDGDIIFICDSHKPDDKEFRRFPKHAVEGSTGSLIVSEIDIAMKNTDGGYFIDKTRYSGFYNTDLEEILGLCGEFEELQVELVGVCTSICVMCTAIDLCNRDILTIVDPKNVADFNQEAHEFALKYMQDVIGVEICT